ncbi:MAG: transposase [Burkholderiales bacterium]
MEAIAKQVFKAEFRAEAVQLVIEQGLSQSEVGRLLKISSKTLGSWVVLARAGKLGAVDAKRLVPVSELEAELSRLKKEVVVLREEREILLISP